MEIHVICVCVTKNSNQNQLPVFNHKTLSFVSVILRLSSPVKVSRVLCTSPLRLVLAEVSTKSTLPLALVHSCGLCHCQCPSPTNTWFPTPLHEFGNHCLKALDSPSVIFLLALKVVCRC